MAAFVQVPQRGYDLFVGLKTDTKPATAQIGARSVEHDTSAEYVWDGSAWVSLIGQTAAEPEDLIFKLLANAGDPDMAVDGGTPVTYEFEVPTGKVFHLQRINVHMQDGSIRADGFGGLAALTNGLLIQAIDTNGTTVLKDFTDGEPVKRHNELALLAGLDVDPDTSGVGGAEDAVLVRWTIAKARKPMRLTAGQIVRVTVRDNISDVTQLRMMVQGGYE